MNCSLGGPLGYYALVLVLLGVQWRPGFSFPTTRTTTSSCDDAVKGTMNLTNLLKVQAKKLQDEYAKFHNINPSVRDDVPDSKISGNTIPEKLQDIYVKGMLFEMHMSKVKEYQGQHSLNNETVDGPLARVQRRLMDLPLRLKIILENTDPKVSLPSKPAQPKLSHSDDFTKKLYGLSVIVRVKEWATGVLQLLSEREVCKVHHVRRP